MAKRPVKAMHREPSNRAKLPTPSREFEAGAICSALSSESEDAKVQTLSGQSLIVQTSSAESGLMLIPGVFPLSWSYYGRLMSVEKAHACAFHEVEAIRGAGFACGSDGSA